MKGNFESFFKQLDSGEDRVKSKSRIFCDKMNITGFANVRVYKDGAVSWITTSSEHDRFLVESGFLEYETLVDTATTLNEGNYLWIHNREFPGSDQFYHERSKKYHVDHGMVIVKHRKDFLETFTFCGCRSKRPLENLFVNELGLFHSFIEYFKSQLDRTLLNYLEEGIHLRDIKSSYGSSPDFIEIKDIDRAEIIKSFGWQNLLLLSKRELECLTLYRTGITHQEIGDTLQLSVRTVEHYMNSVKNKLNLTTRAELYLAADKLVQLGLQQ